MFVVGVFKDIAWADRGLAALVADGFDPAALSVLARASPEVEALVRTHLRSSADARELPRLGQVTTAGPLMPALSGADGRLERAGLSAVCGRAGFLPHDGHIYEALVERGGVLVAVEHGARAAEALARLHAFGAGNAALGTYPRAAV